MRKPAPSILHMNRQIQQQPQGGQMPGILGMAGAGVTPVDATRDAMGKPSMEDAVIARARDKSQPDEIVKKGFMSLNGDLIDYVYGLADAGGRAPAGIATMGDVMELMDAAKRAAKTDMDIEALIQFGQAFGVDPHGQAIPQQPQ